MLLVDLWAYMGDVLHYYIDRAAKEAFLGTATQRDSLLAIASLLDYTPVGRTSAVSSITLNASQSLATNALPILIPAGTRFVATPLLETAEPVIFTLDRNIAFNTDGTTISDYATYPKATPVTVNVTEGEIFIETFTSNGRLSQRFTLSKTGIVATSFVVSVAEGVGGAAVQYARVNRLIEHTNTDPVYLVELQADDSSTLVFGNGIHGKIPTTNAVVSIAYRRSRGAAGNVNPNSIKEFESLSNVYGPSYDGIVITPNSSRATLGSNSESAASLKVNIPAAFRSQDRAVSLQDYIDLSLRVPGIVKTTAEVVVGATAKRGFITNKALSASVATLTTGADHGLTVGETFAIFGVDDTFDGTYVVKSGSSGTNLLYDLNSASVASASVSSSATFMNAQVKIYGLDPQDTYDGTLVVSPTTGPLSLSSSYRDAMYEYLRPREMVGVNSVIMPSITLDLVRISCSVAALPTFVQESVVGDVEDAIKALFTFDNVSFGQKITLGELYRAILAVSGVDYVNITQFTTTSSTVIDTISISPNVQGVKAADARLLLLDDLTVSGFGGVDTEI
jgi:hypothetical protein